MPAEQNKAAIERFYAEAIGKGNVDVIDELMWPDFVHHGDALFPHIEGSAAIKAGVGGVKGAFPDGHTVVEDMVAEGETVVCRLSWKGTHQGAFMGSEPTHQVMAWKGISTYRFENGKIKERWANQDVLPMLQQMGLIHAIGLS